ncbi:MAG: 30S ribosome-binding factor RbfA [Candidatus Acidiferrales bacterium]
MTVAGHRHERIAEEIHHEVSAMLAGELKDPRIAVSVVVTEVRVSPDMKQARVYVSVLGSEEEQESTLKGLEAAKGYVRHELVERLRLRRAPEILFVLDHSQEYGERIEKLLRATKKADS